MKRMTVTAALLLCLSLILGCARLLPKNAPPAGESEALCLGFVQEKLMGSDGGVHTNFLAQEASAGPLAAGHEVLSESQGLLMRYCARTGARAGFERALGFVQNELDSGQILSYRLDPQGERYPVNAAVDDLRILRALLEGEERFREPAYGELAQRYAGRLYETNVRDGRLMDFYDESYRQTADSITLCYADIKTMRLLGKKDWRWKKIAKRMEEIVQGGFLGADFPFYAGRYLPGEGRYETQTIHMAEGLLTVLHLAEVDACDPQTLRWLGDTLGDGALYGEYTVNGEAAGNVESTAVYALCALIGYESGERELADRALERLYALQVRNESSPVYGAFADPVTLAAYSFDNLQALLAMRAGAEWEAGT